MPLHQILLPAFSRGLLLADMESYAKLVGLANGRFKSLFGPTA